MAKKKWLEVLSSNTHYEALVKYAKEHGSRVIPICAELEAQLSEFDAEEKAMYLNDLGIKEAGLDLLIKESYDLFRQTDNTSGRSYQI